MPVYEYECKACGRDFEYQQRMSDPDKTTCEVCGGALDRLISRTAFSAWSARIRNVLSRARSAGIVVRASHRPLTCRYKSSCGRMPGSSSSMGIPDGNIMRSRLWGFTVSEERVAR